MSFASNASPFGLKRSSEAQDFARRASSKLLTWVREHYEIYTLDQANFTPSGLFNYHLRGDYYLGLTKDNAAYTNMGIFADGASRLTNIASPIESVDTAGITRSRDLAARFQSRTTVQPAGGGVAEFGVMNASEPLAPAHPAHFFTREVANGSMLTEFLFAEQATMTYRLLPYMKDFHKGVKEFLTNEAIFFSDNINLLKNKDDGGGQIAHVAQAFLIENFYTMLDAEITPVDVGEVRKPVNNRGGDLIVDLNPFGSFTLMSVNPADPKPCFVLPIAYVLGVMQEYRAISTDVDAAIDARIEAQLRDLLIEAVRTSYRIGGFYTVDALLAPPNDLVLTDCDNFRPRYRSDRAGTRRIVSEKTDDFNQGRVRECLNYFFGLHFDSFSTEFTIGSVVELNFNFQKAFNDFQSNQEAPAMGANDLRTYLQGGAFYRVTASRRGTKRQKNQQFYDLEAVDAAGNLRVAPRTSRLEGVKFQHEDQGIQVPAMRLVRLAGEGSNDPRAHNPLNIIGRLLLTQSYYVFNAGSYYTTKRDMRKLKAEDTTGSYEPLAEALQRGGAWNSGRNGHQAGHRFGILDLYAEQRLDLIADYLAAMYDSLKGKYRDSFVNFYTGDMHTNELSYLTSAVSNYIDSRVTPEDAEREPVLVGPRLTTRLPEETIVSQTPVYPPNHPDVLAGLAVAGDRMPEQTHRQVMNFRTADPELVYYQMDSVLLREALRDLNLEFYQWYTDIAEGLDRGERNFLRGGNLDPDDSNRPMVRTGSGKKGDRPHDKKRIAPTKLILNSMWPLLTDRAKKAVESGEVPAHLMLRRLVAAVTRHRVETSRAIPAVPISTSFINFGELLRSPAQYALPPNLSSDDVAAFVDYLQSTYFNDYGLIANLAADIETVRTIEYSQDQLISAFKRQYNSFRNTKVLNRFSFPATASLVTIFRRLIQTDPNQRAEMAAIITTQTPPAPVEAPAPAAPIPEPMRRA